MPHRPYPPLLEQFLASEAKGGILLFAAALLVFFLANTPWGAGYFALQQVPVGFRVGAFALEKPLLLWVNDLLMALFFLLVGLELKRELLSGELREPRRAGLAVAAALGGMAVPASLYLLLNPAPPEARGWGVPMATDIAFALGVLALLPRVPLGLKLFLTALAIVDDLGAVLVIALFYTEGLQGGYLAGAGLVLALALGLNRLGVRWLWPYLLLGLPLWYLVLQSGVHATLAGVLLALAIPLRRARPFQGATQAEEAEALEGELEALEEAVKEAQSPLHRLEHTLHPWVAYGVLPVFAFFNAGVDLNGLALGPVALGVALGLLVGKPLGVGLLAWLALRLGLGVLPEGVGFRALLGVGFLAGIGFTMALFIAGLAFSGELLDQAKVGVLSASLLAGLLGFLLVRAALDSPSP
ncbi:Na(+)/H(+) antiporter nhaA 1 [Thermus sp. CCB_US3_UF1]|uniref:Na+/H+ antiporter NhaA n=1 Tax=Thermus sp. CCB_US3_UF1 TaxID=1111069 RepID=UPI0002389284|nr:Na+/H+ antiporter NhaA [Thermus sp. CCB_US3_UF1]AEV16562.1 Na(+)/H(+) antiporter nhaA 1 [Thermus sp. CCB_US3_UF1]